MSTQPNLFDQRKTYDVCARRSRNNRQSAEANPTDAYKTEEQMKVLGLIEAKTTWGMTSAELEAPMGKSKHKFSGRIKELSTMKEIVENGRRGGCTVWIAKKFAGGAE